MVEHSSQDQDGEYYRKMDVRLGHSRRDAVFGYLCWTWGVALVMLGSDTIQGKGMQFSEYFLRIFLQIVMRPSHGSSPEIFPLRYLQQVAAALLEPQLVSSRSHQRCSEHGRNGHLSSKATCCASIASSRRLSSFPASDGLKPRGFPWKLVKKK